MTTISEFFMATLSGLPFAAVCRAMEGVSNIGGYIAAEFDAFARQLGGQCFIPMATHSLGGREWRLREGATPLFFQEPAFSGGWWLLTDSDAEYLRAESATSPSWLEATKGTDGTWTLTVQVPVDEDGTPYRGFYWRAFQSATFATFAGGGSLWGEGPPCLGQGSFDRSSELVEWVPAPGYPKFAPRSDYFKVVAQDGEVAVVLTEYNCHDSQQKLWVIRKDDPEWRTCGVVRQPNSAGGVRPFREFRITPEGILAACGEGYRGEELFPWEQFQ